MVIKPTVITLGMFLILNLGVGSIVHAISPLDWVTSLLCVVPGGIADIPIIASAMGADTPKVALAQLSRYILGVAVFPPMILGFDNFPCGFLLFERLICRRPGLRPGSAPSLGGRFRQGADYGQRPAAPFPWTAAKI